MKRLLFLILFISCSDEPFDPNAYEEFADESFRKIENSITINIIPSTYELEWTTPRMLIFSILKNQYYFPKTKSYIGHVSAEVNCFDGNNQKREFIGQSSHSLDGFRNFILGGYGFSLLNKPQNNYDLPLLMVAGKLDDYSEVNIKYAEYMANKNFAILTTKMSEKSCLRALSYIKEYKKKTIEGKEAGNRYGFGADPLKFEGAGCAPMVQTILSLADLESLSSGMDQEVFIPKELLGDPEIKNKVSLWKVLTNNKNISNSGNGGVKFSFPDPQQLYDITKNSPLTRTIDDKFLYLELNSEK